MKWLKWTSVMIVFILIGYYGFCKLYPCLSSPIIAKPVYTWKLCSMDIFNRMYIIGVSERYFGLAQGWVIALFLNLIIAYLIVAGLKYGYDKIKK